MGLFIFTQRYETGPDGIAAELVKNGGARLENEIHQIVTEVWNSELMTCYWNHGIIYTIYKKGDRLGCNNYSLMPHIEKIVGNYQRGFRNGK